MCECLFCCSRRVSVWFPFRGVCGTLTICTQKSTLPLFTETKVTLSQTGGGKHAEHLNIVDVGDGGAFAYDSERS